MQIHEITTQFNENVVGRFGKTLANKFTQSTIGVNAFSDKPESPFKPTQPRSNLTPPPPPPAFKPLTPAAPSMQVGPSIMVSSGMRIKVVDPKTKGVYYKTEQGWFNELNQPVGVAGSAYLEQLADQGLAREEPIPVAPAVAAAKVQQQRKKKKRR